MDRRTRIGLRVILLTASYIAVLVLFHLALSKASINSQNAPPELIYATVLLVLLGFYCARHVATAINLMSGFRWRFGFGVFAASAILSPIVVPAVILGSIVQYVRTPPAT